MNALLSAQLHFLYPELFLCLGGIVLLMAGVFSSESIGSVARVNFAAIVVLFVSVCLIHFSPLEQLPKNTIFADDTLAIYGKIFVLVSAIFTLVISHGWLGESENRRFEFPVLLLFSVVGMQLMCQANDMLIFYLGLELSSLAQYVLASFNRDRLRSTESGIKYFILGSLASGMLLFGISLVYGFSGSIGFAGIAQAIHAIMGQAAAVSSVPYGLTLGMILILVALSFKISAAPFHMWTPDVYEGAPTPVTAFFATAPKIAATVVLIRLLAVPFGDLMVYWRQIVVTISLLSMLVGAFGALRQVNLKRLLAYSSIGHIGYTLMGLAAGTPSGMSAVLVYLAIYIFMTIGAFGCLMMMARGGERVEQIGDLAGIGRRHPWFALALLAFMFSMAGIPPFAGFFAKFYVFLAAVQSGLVVLAVLGVLSSVVAAYYYLRIVKVMYFEEGEAPLELSTSISLRFCVGLCAAFNLIYVVDPSLFSEPALAAVRALLP